MLLLLLPYLCERGGRSVYHDLQIVAKPSLPRVYSSYAPRIPLACKLSCSVLNKNHYWHFAQTCFPSPYLSLSLSLPAARAGWLSHFEPILNEWMQWSNNYGSQTTCPADWLTELLKEVFAWPADPKYIGNYSAKLCFCDSIDHDEFTWRKAIKLSLNRINNSRLVSWMFLGNARLKVWWSWRVLSTFALHHCWPKEIASNTRALTLPDVPKTVYRLKRL